LIYFTSSFLAVTAPLVSFFFASTRVQEEERHNKKTARKKREKVHKTDNLRDAIAID
jgi:hypothetical protein